ncbi:MAG: mercuric reductase [Leptolyngbyaceae cyanobacterium RM1_406_9]|nr:mercuric reductase [Leptolyngbyaceae cyanobacterium RM1_406_9]
MTQAGTKSVGTEPVFVSPMDHYNQELIANLHPADWVNPTPAQRYNLVVIGAGTAGLVTAAGAGLLGAKVALIEKHLMGGDCTNVGCVPSKAMIRSARVAGEIRRAKHYGINVPGKVTVDFSTVMERLRRVRTEISPNDSATRFQQEFGVDVFFGEARFSGADTVEVAGQTLRFKKAAIATGSSPLHLPIEGLEESGYLTNETVFSLTEKPDRLAVIGGGYIGCELAQTFRRLGSEVVLFQRGSRLLDREDLDASNLVQQVFIQEGIRLVLKSQIKRIEQKDSVKVIHYEADGQENAVTVDEILVGAGRKPNIQGLNLEAVGVKTDSRKGVIIDDYLQTSNSNIYAVGDVCMKWKFTHAADAAARILIQNALFAIAGIGRKKLSSLVMPWCTYTDPEVAHVGLYPHEAEEQGMEIDTFCVSLNDVDRAIVDDETEGFLKIHVKQGTDEIVGATLVARHAGEIISQVTLAMTNGVGLGAIANTIYPYPTQAEILRKAASQYSLKRLTTFKSLASKFLAWRR